MVTAARRKNVHMMRNKRKGRREGLCYLILHLFHQLVMGNTVKVALDVCIHYPWVSILQEFFHSPQRIFTSSSWPKAVTLFRKCLLQYRLHYIPHRRLHHSVGDHGDS